MSEIKTAEMKRPTKEECNGFLHYSDRLNSYIDYLEKKINQFPSQEVTDEKIEKEAIQIIELLMSYGSIHTIKGVRYPEGTHEEALKRAANYLNKMRDKIFKTK